MNRKLLLPVMAAAGVIGAGFLFAQTADDENEGSTLERDEPNEIWRFKWWGKTGRTYFIQHSEDLMLWNWVPVVESGNDAVKEWGFTSTSDKFFLRLRYTDTPSNDPENDDFDLDGVANLAEVMQGSNPFSWEDTDNDGLPDDWEIHHFGNLDYNGTHDPDGDGLTNLQEFIYHTDPMDFGNLATNPLQDGDGNGLPDWWEILNFGTLGNNPNQTVAANGGLTLQQIYDNDLELGVAATLGDGVPDAWKIANGLSTTDPNVANETRTPTASPTRRNTRQEPIQTTPTPIVTPSKTAATSTHLSPIRPRQRASMWRSRHGRSNPTPPPLTGLRSITPPLNCAGKHPATARPITSSNAAQITTSGKQSPPCPVAKPPTRMTGSSPTGITNTGFAPQRPKAQPKFPLRLPRQTTGCL